MGEYFVIADMWRRLTCLFLIPGLILMAGCATSIPRVDEPKAEAGESTLLGSQTFEGAEVVMVTAVVATLVMLCLAGLAIYLGLRFAQD